MHGVEDLMVGQSRKMKRRHARTDPCRHGSMIYAGTNGSSGTEGRFDLIVIRDNPSIDT
jgi:hypothetical protein